MKNLTKKEIDNIILELQNRNFHLKQLQEEAMRTQNKNWFRSLDEQINLNEKINQKLINDSLYLK